MTVHFTVVTWNREICLDRITPCLTSNTCKLSLFSYRSKKHFKKKKKNSLPCFTLQLSLLTLHLLPQAKLCFLLCIFCYYQKVLTGFNLQNELNGVFCTSVLWSNFFLLWNSESQGRLVHVRYRKCLMHCIRWTFSVSNRSCKDLWVCLEQTCGYCTAC